MDRGETRHLTVQEVLRRWPQTVAIFIRHRMHCLGCSMAPFDRIEEVAPIYGLETDKFVQELQEASMNGEGEER